MRHVVRRLSGLYSAVGLQSAHSSTYLQKQRLREAAASIILNDDTASGHSADSQQDLAEFDAAYPTIENDLTETSGRYADAEMANKWFKKVLEYNLSGGSKSRGLALVQSYKILAVPYDVEENLRLAHIMGWCIELLHTSLVMTQDLIDQASERRGKPCWYLQNPRQAPDGAARLIESAIYKLIKKYFRTKDYYIDSLELMHTVGEKAMLGKVLDLEVRGTQNLSQFYMTNYNTISKYRNAYHSFKLPVSLALYMAGIRNPEMHRQARTIQLEMGNFFQAQCDFFNCYGGGRWDHARPGHDIEDGRCTWLIVVALQRATVTQRKELIVNYGQKEPEKVNRVKEVYADIGIPHTYKLYEAQSYELICNSIQQLSGGLPHQLFFRFLKTMTGR